MLRAERFASYAPPTSAINGAWRLCPQSTRSLFHGSDYSDGRRLLDPFSRDPKYLIRLLALNHYLRRIFNSTDISQIPRERELAFYRIWDVGAAILILETTILSYDVVGTC
jgi:hypothetical protein